MRRSGGALLGGCIRAGFENNCWRPDGSLVGSNAELVGLTAAQFLPCRKEAMSAQQLRELWAAVIA
ncbi:3-keto-5-aminohexanoate cleavage protein [Mesorhizobium sp. M0955]|uniref:3-keto-5-aminohexanoate cleavage protein n=1 Tax=Mesorhizobium sp. M0955 TaxID=2957033 RepID=UPI003339D0B2